MALEMREVCERCGARLAAAGEAYICSYECTFCSNCASTLRHSCSNCQNELVRRPRKSQACDMCELPSAATTEIQVE